MAKTLRERHEERLTVEHMLISEALSDYFKPGSDNIKKFNATLAQLKNLANTYKLSSLQNAVINAEQQFTSIVTDQAAGRKTDTNKATMLSKVVTFVAAMGQFMDTFKNVTAQLPALKQAIDNSAKSPGPETLEQILGPQAQQFGQLIATQFQKSGGGVINAISRFAQGGGVQSPAKVMTEFGVDPQTLANDILKLTPTQVAQFAKQSATTPSFQLNTQSPQPTATTASVPSSPTASQTPNAQASGPQGQQNAAGTPPVPAASTQPATANAAAQQTNQKPDPTQVASREQALQQHIKNRNAFNTQYLSGLSNDQVKQDLLGVAKALGITL